VSISPSPVSGAVEGVVDEAVVRVLLKHAGRITGAIYVQNGKPRLLAKLAGFNAAARFQPWLVLFDLNGDADCAPGFLGELAYQPARYMILRIAVRQIEAWLMADRERLARYLRISRDLIPRDPESELDPKQTMVNLARRSRDRHIRGDMVPTAQSGRKTGPNYAGRLIEFTTLEWRPAAASECADSLNRCIQRLNEVDDPQLSMHGV
jgi:hypothetical protein